MIDIASEYTDHHVDLIDAAAAFTMALVGGDPSKPNGYTFDSAVLATADAFELQPREMIKLVTRLAVKATT